MSAAHDGGAAFPMQDQQAIHAYAMGKVAGMSGDTDERDRAYLQARAEAVGGMSLRDYFAASVIGHLTASPLRQENTIEHDASYAYKVADAMLKERSK